MQVVVYTFALQDGVGNVFCSTSERTTVLVPPVRKESAGGRIHEDEMGFGIHLMVDLDAWRIPAFSLIDENSKGAVHLFVMLYSVLDEYATSGILLPRAVAHIVDVAYGTTGRHRQGLDG